MLPHAVAGDVATVALILRPCAPCVEMWRLALQDQHSELLLRWSARLCCVQGRPKGPEKKSSLEPVAKRMSGALLRADE